jgi:uric acid-xanthine permease
METGFAITAFLALILNLIIPQEIEDEEIPEFTANEADVKKDREEWDRIRGKSVDVRNGGSASGGSPSEPTDDQKKV